MENYQSQGVHADEFATHRKLSAQSQHAIVELGVLVAEVTEIMAQSNAAVPIYGIDPIIPDSMNADLIGSIDRINKRMAPYANFTFINDYSYNVVKTWDKWIGYLFIDADHTYAAVKQDFEDWFPFVVEGGFISLHDSACDRGGPHWWPGPSQLAQELIKDPRVEYVETWFALTVFKKK